MDNQILQFPKEKSKRVQRLKKAEGQKLFLTLSLMSFILVAVLSNEHLMKQQRPVYLISDNSTHSIDQVNRAIASAQPMNLFRDVEWEHDLAKRLAAKEDRQPASTPQKVTLFDELRYGVLAGKYRIISARDLDAKGPQVKEVEYIDSQELADRPVQISDRREFLKSYGQLLPVQFAQATLAQTKDGVETWNLVSSEGKTVGEVQMRFDEAKHFLGLKVQPLDRVAAE